MNIDEILRVVQDFRSNLELWGVTNQTLWAAGAFAALLFVVSLREVLTWYLRMQQVRDEVRALRVQMNEMQKTLNDTRELLQRGRGSESSENLTQPLKASELYEMAQSTRSGEALKIEKTSAPKKFRLDH